jgi:hypothetical protein
MLLKSVTKASLTDDVARLVLADVDGIESGTPVKVAGIGHPFDGNFNITGVDYEALWVEYDKNHVNVLEDTVTGQLEILVNWIDDNDVENFLGVAPATEGDGDFLSGCTDASNKWCFERRRKSGYCDLPNAVPGADVKMGAVLYAASLYRERGSVDSFASFQDMGSVAPIGNLGQILRLLGCNRPRVH